MNTLSKKELDALLDEGIDQVRHDLPDDTACQAAADRALDAALARLAASPSPVTPEGADSHETLRGCDDVQPLLGVYVAGELPENQALLIQDHTRECLPCRRALMAAREGRKVADAPGAWSPEQGADAQERPHAANRGWWLAAAAAVVVAFGVAVLFATGLIGGAGTVYAEVDAIDGGLYLVDDAGSRPLSAGESIRRGDEVRTARGSGAVLTLTDGSQVEMRERTALTLFQGRRDTTVDLARGSVIVEASKRSRGHLYVDTEDCRVAVTGTIFSVNHGTKGSRVSVVEGSVRVEQGRSEEMLQPGEQVTTRAYLAAVPFTEELSWSRNFDEYIALLTEINALHEELRRAVPSPSPRTSTALLDLAPANTTVYAAVPNVAESLSEARRVFHQRLAASPVLSGILDESGSAAHQQELDALFERIRDYGSFLGDEVVFALAGPPSDEADPAGVVFAQVLEPEAFRAFLEQEIAGLGADAPIHLVSDPSEAVGGSESVYLWLTDGYVVASTGADGLLAMSGALGSGAAFEGSPFHATLADAYRDGVEWIFAIDLESVVDSALAEDDAAEDLFGFEDARYALAQWSEAGDRSSARAVVTFDGPRHGVASWLAAPAPMGSLEYVTGDAAAAAAFVVRDPAEMVDEMMAALLDRDPEALADFERMQAEQGFDLRADLAEPLGGEMAIALDGPLVPEPSIKAVIEVYDPARLQDTLERMVVRLDQEMKNQGLAKGISLTSEVAGGRTYHRVATPAEATDVYYTYDDAYLVAAPSRALLDTALSARSSGANLPASQEFRALLPADGYTNFSAVVYQDLGSRLAPFAKKLAEMQESGRNLTAEERDTLAKTAALHPPTLGYAYGEEDRIVFAASLGEGSFLMKALLGGAGGMSGIGGLEGLMADIDQQAASVQTETSR